MNDIDKKELGRRIRGIRISRGFTLEEFGEFFKAGKSNVSQWERGLSIPNADRIYKISKFANITVDELLYGNNQDIEELYKKLIRLSNDEIIYIMKRVAEYVKEERNDIRNY